MEKKIISPLKAVRLKCLDCCSGSSNEVRLCPAEKCPLHPFRFGKNPNRAGLCGNGGFMAKRPHSAADISENVASEM